MKASDFAHKLTAGGYDAFFRGLYAVKSSCPDSIHAVRTRYRQALSHFCAAFGGERDVGVFSAPGRTEIGGNHTDHNAGYVLAASVNLDIISIASKNGDGRIRLHSEGFAPVDVDLSAPGMLPGEKYTPAALVRGVAARMRALGLEVGGFDCHTTSAIPSGAGLSSSAAFEVQLCAILNHLYNGGRMDAVQSARIGQYAENEYFGKPCGLMDQIACAVGGLLQIDFEDAESPAIERVDFDLASVAHTLYIVDTGGSHAGLNEDYAALASEMKQTAALLGAPVLRRASRSAFFDNLAMLRESRNDRAILRACHFFNENRRVLAQVQALKAGDFGRFKALVVESGHSSFMYCQNVYANASWYDQGIAVGLMLAEDCLGERGAWRVHGGGFAGTIQAYVPDGLAEEFERRMAAVFGRPACHRTMIRPRGAVRVDAEP